MFKSIRRPEFCISAIGLALALPCLGQSTRQVMIVNSSEGGGPAISHFSMPDLMELREPDFAPRDLPIFQEKLVLSEAQSAAIQRQIELYLEAFQKLVQEMLSFPGAEPMIVKALPGGNAEMGEAPPGTMVIAPPNLDDLPQITVDELEEAPGPGLDIGVRMPAIAGGDDDGGEGMETSVSVSFSTPEGEDKEPSVSVSFATPDGEEIPEKLRQELEKRAAEMAENIKQKFAEQREKAAAGEDGAPLPPLPGAVSMEELQQRQSEILAAAKAFRKAKADLRQNFVVEAQTGLSEPQIERWPALERALLREKSLPRGRLSGERTDLFKVLKNLDSQPVANDRVAAQLDSYELDLDAALRQRNEALEDVGPKVDKAMQEREFDRALLILDRAAAARVAVRSVNERHAQAIAELLPPDAASDFTTETLKTSYPQIYRTTLADRTFRAAHGLEDLDEDTRQRIAELEQAYRVERSDVDTMIRRDVDKHEPTEPRRPIERLKEITSGAQPETIALLKQDDPVRESFGKRRELDERYIKSITALLTPEQIEHLPKAPRKRTAEPIIIRSGG